MATLEYDGHFHAMPEILNKLLCARPLGIALATPTLTGRPGGKAAKTSEQSVCPSNGLANGLANCRKLVRPTNLHAPEKEEQREREREGGGAKYAANTLGQITCTSQLTVNGKRAWQKNSYKGFYCYNWQIENCALAANAGESEAVQLEQLPLPQFVAHSRRALASAQSQVQRLMR